MDAGVSEGRVGVNQYGADRALPQNSYLLYHYIFAVNFFLPIIILIEHYIIEN